MSFVRFFLAASALIQVALPGSAADHTGDSLEKVKELLAAKKAVLVDVREQVEWDSGHIAGAKLVPLSRLKGKIGDEELKKIFPPDKIVYLYCAGGYRCLDVAEMFEDSKLQLRALKQGYTSLLTAGFPKAEDDKPAPNAPSKK